MTTIDDLCAVLDTIGLPWTQVAWERGDDAELPYIVLMPTGADNTSASDEVWTHITTYDVELYCKRRDYQKEAIVASALEAAGIFWESGGYWFIDSESMFETVFTVTVRE